MTQQNELFFHLSVSPTTRESQYSTKPYEQTLSVDLCGTAGKHFTSSLILALDERSSILYICTFYFGLVLNSP